MKTILFKTIIIAFFVGTAVSCSDEDENRFRPGSTHEKPNPTEPEGGLDYSKLTADNHPRLLMNAEAFTALKAKVDANASANLTLLHNTIMGVCNSKGMNATALTYKLDASNKRILDVSRDALLRIFTCAYAYRMTGDAKYLTKAETDINAVCNFPDWNSKRHFLDVGEMATAVAFGYDWLYNELSASTRTKAANANPSPIGNRFGFFLFGGRGWIRTTEAESSRFTVCPHWPLGNTPIFIFAVVWTACICYH